MQSSNSTLSLTMTSVQGPLKMTNAGRQPDDSQPKPWAVALCARSAVLQKAVWNRRASSRQSTGTKQHVRRRGEKCSAAEHAIGCDVNADWSWPSGVRFTLTVESWPHAGNLATLHRENLRAHVLLLVTCRNGA